MWNKDTEATTPEDVEAVVEESEKSRKEPNKQRGRMTFRGVTVALHWLAQRRVAGKRKVVNLKHSFEVTENEAKELRKGRLSVINEQLLEIEKKELGGYPQDRTWRRTEG